MRWPAAAVNEGVATAGVVDAVEFTFVTFILPLTSSQIWKTTLAVSTQLLLAYEGGKVQEEEGNVPVMSSR